MAGAQTGHALISMTSDTHLFDLRALTQRRDRAAARVEAHDFLLQRVAEDLLVRLGAVKRQFPTVVDLGAHHGVLARSVRQLPGVSLVISADSSWRMLSLCPPPRLLVDLEALPFADASLDLVVSGLTLHLVNDLTWHTCPNSPCAKARWPPAGGGIGRPDALGAPRSVPAGRVGAGRWAQVLASRRLPTCATMADYFSEPGLPFP